MKQPEFAVAVRSTVKRVSTYRTSTWKTVMQNHRGYTATVHLRGDPEPHPTGTFHQKAKAARAAGEKYGRWLVKTRKEQTHEQG